jgi:hypothetical protein
MSRGQGVNIAYRRTLHSPRRTCLPRCFSAWHLSRGDREPSVGTGGLCGLGQRRSAPDRPNRVQKPSWPFVALNTKFMLPLLPKRLVLLGAPCVVSCALGGLGRSGHGGDIQTLTCYRDSISPNSTFNPACVSCRSGESRIARGVLSGVDRPLMSRCRRRASDGYKGLFARP